MRAYILFWKDMIKGALFGSWLYYFWVILLLAVIGFGVSGYLKQLEHGLIVTNLTDQVSWGAYIANFTYIVGLAAAAVMLVIPAYVYKIESVKKIVLVGELFAIASLVMCLLFVIVDLGRPDRLWHILPGIGRMNFPSSILAWDVFALNGYLLLSLHIPGYLLFKRYKGEQPAKLYYLPFVFISILWAVSIHTVTAFLYVGLGGRPFWNSAIVAPRFLASAFAVGPCFLMIILQLVRKFFKMDVKDEVLLILKRIIAVTLIINLFLLGCELFKELYTNSAHTASMKYLIFGLHGHILLVPFFWTAVALNIIAVLIFIRASVERGLVLLNIGSVCAIVGIWIEKGMGLIVPGFIPTPLGDIAEYSPSFVEFQVALGIWALGSLLLTVFLKAVIPIEMGKVRYTPRTS